SDGVALRAEPPAEPAEPGYHLVGAKQDPVAVADLAHAGEVAGRRRERAAGVLYRFHNHHSDRLRSSALDRGVEVVEQHCCELLITLARRPAETVRVAHMDHIRDERLERSATSRNAMDRKRTQRCPGVSDVAADRLPASLAARRVELSRELPRRLDRLGAARDEEDAVQVVWGERREFVRELDCARMRV